MSFDAGRIVATADLDRTPFQRGITEIRAEGRRLQGQTFKANVGADTREGDAKILDFRRKLDQVSTGKSTAKVSADTTEALLKIKPLTDRLAELRNRVSTARVDLAGNDRAQRALDQLDLSLRQVGTITSKPRVSLSGAESAEIQLDRLALKLRAVGAMEANPGVSGGSGGFLSSLSSLGSHAPGGRGLLLAGALPLVPPLAGLAAGGAASFLTPTLAGGIGGGLFAKAAMSTYTGIDAQIKKLTADQASLQAATTSAGKAAARARVQMDLSSLSGPQRAAAKNMDAIDKSWTSFQKKLQPQTFKLLGTGATIASKGLKLLLPTAQASGNAINSLATGAEHALTQPFWQDFFTKFLPGEAHRALMTLGTDLGHGVTGIANLMEKFAPLGHSLESATKGWSKTFENWTQGQGPGKFVNWVQQNGPGIVHDLAGIAHGVEGIGKGLMPIGQIELKAFGSILNFIGNLADEHPGVITALGAAYLTVAGGLKAVAAVSGISKVATAVGSLVSALKAGQGLKALPGMVGGSSVGAPTLLRRGAAGGAALGPELGAGAGLGAGAEAGAGAAGFGAAITAPEVAALLAPVVISGIAIAILDAHQSKAPGAGPVRAAEATQPKPFSVGRAGQVIPIVGADGQSPAALLKADYAIEQASVAEHKLFTAQEAVRKSFRNALPALSDFKTGLSQMGQVAANVGSRKITGMTDAAKANRITLKGQVSDLNAYKNKLIDAGRPMDVVKAKVDAQALSLIHNAHSVYQNKSAVDALLSRYGLIPKQIRTQIVAQTKAAAAAMAALQKQKQELAAKAVLTIDIVTHGSIPNPRGGPAPRIGPGGATGGFIQGPGTPTSDSIPAWLSNGEYVLRASAVRHWGVDMLHEMNAYAAGGTVKKKPSSSSSSTSSSSKPSGPSKATIANALASIAQFAGLTFVNDLEGTAKTIKSGITQMIDRLNNAVRNHYLSGDKKLVTALKGSQKTLVNLANTEDQVSKSLTAAQSRLSSLRSDASQVRSGTVGSFLGLGDLTQASSTTTLGGLLSVDSQQVKVAKAFHRNLQTLRKKGLSQAEYRALEAAGPGAAGNIVGLLATANKSQIGQFNHDESILHTLGISTGKASASYLDGQRIKDARKEVGKLRSEEHKLRQDQHRAALAMEKLVKAGLQDKGTHAALATLHKDNAEIKQLLAHIANAPGQAKRNHRTHVPGVH